MNTLKFAVIFVLMPVLCLSQINELQPIGSISTHLIYCPCKLFKYYEKNTVFYYCVDRETQIEYTIRQFQHKDLIDVAILSLKQLSSTKNQPLSGNHDYLLEYLGHNKNGIIIDFLYEKAVLVDNQTKKKLFFSSNDKSVSYEVVLSGANQNLPTYFQKTIKSIISKKEHFKSNF
tara:strand:- start:102 stop:626 length:525 start_codon:yes stop_codon:yes gene_type:complete